MAAPAYAVVWRLQQPVDQKFVGIGSGILQEVLDFLSGRRQPKEVKAETANQRGAIRFGRWRDVLLIEPGQHKGVDRIVNPCSPRHVRDRRSPRTDEGPMDRLRNVGNDKLCVLRPVGTLLDPGA